MDVQIFRKYNKPEKIRSFYPLKDVDYPYYEVNGEIYHSKYYAIKACVEQGIEFPNYIYIEKEKGFRRPQISFQEACVKQAVIISDTSKKVRLWYSGGRDSNHVLETFLRSNTKLDEICTYRRFPAVYDNIVNEYDRYNVLESLKKTLIKYDKKIPIKIYDVIPEHFDYWANNLEESYFPYTPPRIVAHTLQPLFEFYPDLFDDTTNIISDSVAYLDGDEFCFLDGKFNFSMMDPYVCHFFCDSRNMDITTNMMYFMYDNNCNEYNMKEQIGFYKSNSPLDHYDQGEVGIAITEENWLWDMKDMRFHYNMIQTEQGRNNLKKFYAFYTDVENRYKKYFNKGSIWNDWICSTSKKQKLLDI